MHSQITLPILNMRMRLVEPTKWDSFTVSAQVLLIWVVTPPPPSFSVSWHTFTSTIPPLHHSQLHSSLERPALACQQALLNPQHHPPVDFTTHTHSLVFEFPLKCDRSHLTGDTHTWCYRVRARDSASWVMRNCHSHCLSTLQEGREGNDREKASASFFLCHISLKGKSGSGEKEPLHVEFLATTSDNCGTLKSESSHGRHDNMTHWIGFCYIPESTRAPGPK